MVCAWQAAEAFRVDSLRIASPRLEKPMDVLVVVPDAATSTTADSESRFPTMYLLHGYSGNYCEWVRKAPELGPLADRYGMIVVTPDGRDGWYWDSPRKKGMQLESFITGELVPYIDSHYPTAADRRQRAITGLSMGGHGAMFLASRHPGLFGLAGSMSGGLDLRPFPKSWNLREHLGPIEENAALWDSMTAASYVDALKAGDVKITFDCGSDDFFAGVNDAFHQALLQAGVPHDYTSRPGSHNWDYWRNSLPYHMLFFSRNFGL